MRKIIINIILFGGISALLAAMNFPITTWEFWLILSGMIGVQINNSLD